MSYAIVGILVVAFIAFVVLSAKAWHWSNIVFLCLTFLAGLGGLIAMSQVLDSRLAAMKDVAKSEADLKRTNEQIDQVLVGDVLSHEYSPDSLRGLSEALSLELAGQGRVWKNGGISASGQKRVFQLASPRIEFDPSTSLLTDMILFVYSDRVFENDDNIYPAVFVGSFRVAAETADTIELEPIFISDQDEYNAPTSSWTLFEKSPVDQRDAYIRDTDIVIDFDSANLNADLNNYRNVLVQEHLPAELFGLDLSDRDQAREYELIIDRHLFDGLPLVKIESWIASQSDRLAQRFDPTPEEIFVRYRFDEKSNRPYQVDATGNIENDGQFTKNGYAVDPSLHAGGEIEFQKGDEILVDQLTADGYQRGDEPVPPYTTLEPVTEVNRVFVRQLNDYPFLLQTLQRQNELYTKEIERVKSDNERSSVAIANAEAQATMRDTEIENLLADQGKFQQDDRVISEFLDATKQRKEEVETGISRIAAEIKNQSKRLRAIFNAIEEKLSPNRESGTEVIAVPNGSGPFLSPDSTAPFGSLDD